MLERKKIVVEVARKVVYGSDAVQRLPNVCKQLGLDSVILVCGPGSTNKIVEQTIKPLMIDIDTKVIINTSESDELSTIKNIQDHIDDYKALIAVGGGRVMDIVKVVSFASNIPWISLPTSASHDGFSSPFIGFILRRKLSQEGYETVKPRSPLAIIGDTTLIAQAPFEHVIAGVGDLVSKFVAVKDWELAHRLRGEPYDEYAATFGLMSAKVVEEGYSIIAQGYEPGIRLVVKALGNSGVAMSIAGNSRPASGSEHLISHYLDYMAIEQKRFTPRRHGYQVGLASILCSYLQGGDWQKILKILRGVKHPTKVEEIGLDKDTFLEAVLNAHTIRPERYTILGNGLTTSAALQSMEATGIID